MSDDDCITIDSEEEELQKEETKLVVKPEDVQSKYLKNGRKYAHIRSIDGTDLYEQFLDKCKTAIRPVADAEKGIRKMRRLFSRADTSYRNQISFVNLLQMNFPKIAEEPWQCMKKVADELRLHSIKKPPPEDPAPENLPDSQTNELDKRTLRQIAKLKLLLAKLHTRIQSLEEEEVNFDESGDEDSNYLKVTRYKTRFCQVHSKICELERAGNDDSSKTIRFSGTKIPSVNRAIERFYNDNKEFPDYHDIFKVVEVVNDRRQLNLTEFQIHDTAKIAFEELGQTLKLKRQYDFHDTMCSYLPNHQEDPAAADDQLQEKLLENQRLHGHKIDEIINKYATKQEENRLEGVEVGSGEEQMSENEEEEENDDDEVTSASDFEMDQSEDEEQVRPCTVRLLDITMSPIWEKYCPKVPELMKIEPDFQQPCCSKSLVTQRKGRAESDSSDSEIHDKKRSKVQTPTRIVTSTPLSNFVKNENRDKEESNSKKVLSRLNLENIENVIVLGEHCPSENTPASRKSEDEENFSSKTVKNEVDSDKTKNFDSMLGKVSELLAKVSEPNNRNRKFAGSNFDVELKTSVSNKVAETTKKNIPNGAVSPIRKTEQDPKPNADDDDVVIIDEIPSKSKAKANSRSDEIINVDKLENTNSAPQRNFPNIDLGAFIKKINFSLPNGTSVSTVLRKPNAPPCRPAQSSVSLVPRSTIPNIAPIRRMTIPPNYRVSRIAQSGGMSNTNYMRPSLIQNRNAFFNQSSQRRLVQNNEVRRFVQNNQIIARRKTTTVEESIVQLSAARSSQIPNQGFSRTFRNNAFSSSLQTTRKLVQVNHATQLHEVKSLSTEELIQLD